MANGNAYILKKHSDAVAIGGWPLFIRTIILERLKDRTDAADDVCDGYDGSCDLVVVEVDELVYGDRQRPVAHVRVDLLQDGHVPNAEAQVVAEGLEEDQLAPACRSWSREAGVSAGAPARPASRP